MNVKLVVRICALFVGSFGHNMLAMQARIVGRIAPRVVTQTKPQVPARIALAHKFAPQFDWQKNKRDLHINHIKGIDEKFGKQHKHLSPVVAAPFAETRWLQNLYQFGNHQDATVRLARSLFYLQDTQFRPTLNRSLPCSSLTPQLVGRIIGSIEQGMLKSPHVQDSIATEWKNQHPGPMTKTKILGVLNMIQESLAEYDKGMYLAHTTHLLLLSFLYKKYEHRADIDVYIKTVLQDLMTQSAEKTSETALSVLPEFTDEDFIKYSKKLKKLTPKEASILFTTDVEETVHYFVSKIKYQSKTPPQVVQRSYGFNGQSPAPDCVETAFREICNSLLVNGTDSHFDISTLPAHIKPVCTFVEFYNSFKQFDTVNTTAAGQAWMNLVSGHNFLRYNGKKNYELKPSVSNLLKLCNYFFAISAKNLDELGKLLSDSRRKVTFKIIKEKKDSDASVEIKSIGKKTNSIMLEITAGHAYVERSDEYTECLVSPRVEEMLEQKLPSYYQRNKHLIPFFSNVCISNKEVMTNLVHSNTPLFLYCIYTLQLEDPNISKSIITFLFEELPKKPTLSNTIAGLLSTIPDDEYFLIKIAELIATYNSLIPQEQFDAFLQKHQPASKTYLHHFFDKDKDTRKFDTLLQAYKSDPSNKEMARIVKILQCGCDEYTASRLLDELLPEYSTTTITLILLVMNSLKPDSFRSYMIGEKLAKLNITDSNIITFLRTNPSAASAYIKESIDWSDKPKINSTIIDELVTSITSQPIIPYYFEYFIDRLKNTKWYPQVCTYIAQNQEKIHSFIEKKSSEDLNNLNIVNLIKHLPEKSPKPYMKELVHKHFASILNYSNRNLNGLLTIQINYALQFLAQIPEDWVSTPDGTFTRRHIQEMITEFGLVKIDKRFAKYLHTDNKKNN